MPMRKDLESELFHVGLVFLAVGTAAGIVYFFVIRKWLPQIPCLLFTLTGIYCPGCGGTRALVSLLQGHILQAIWYHPLIPYSAAIAGGFMLTQGLSRIGIRRIKGWKFHNWYLYGAMIIIVCNFVIKNLLLLIWNITL